MSKGARILTYGSQESAGSVRGNSLVMTTPCGVESINGSFSFIMMLLAAGGWWPYKVDSSASACSLLPHYRVEPVGLLGHESRADDQK